MSLKRIILASAAGAFIIIVTLWKVPLSISQVTCSETAKDCSASIVRTYGFPFRLRETSETQEFGETVRNDAVSPAGLLADFLVFFLMTAALGVMQSPELTARFRPAQRHFHGGRPPGTF